LLPRFSGYLSLGAASDEYLTHAKGGYSFGLFGTPLDTRYVDLDLLLDVGMTGENFNQIGVTPGFELNFDLKPDRELWGLYVRIQDTLSGRDESVEDDPATPNVNEAKKKFVLTRATHHTFGTYFTIAGRHQILAEYYQTANSNPALGELGLDSDGFALGYNVMLADNLELITQANCHPGHDHQDATWGGIIGIIVTIPRTSSKTEEKVE